MKSILLVPAAVCLWTVSLAAQSLGDVAKKAEQERQVPKPASKVYTNKDLKDAPAPGPATALVTTSAPREQTEGERQDDYRKTARKDEAYWKERMRTAQAALDGHRTFLAAAVERERELNARLHRNESRVLDVGKGGLRLDIDGQWQAAVAEVSRLTAAVEIDRVAIIALQEEARRANVPPGWLRP